MIYFDTFGPKGGVGRVSQMLIPALASQTKVIVAGASYPINSMAMTLAPNACITFENLTPRRKSIDRLRYEISLRSDRYKGGLFDLLMSRLSKLQSDRQALLINYPQILHPPRKSFEYSIFIHDLNWRQYPQNFPNPALVDRWTREWVDNSKFTFCNSDFVRDEVLSAYNIGSSRVVAAPLAPFPSLDVDSQHRDFLLSQLHLRHDEFYLFPGVLGAHKGHDILAEALMMTSNLRPVVVTCGQPSELISSAPSPELADYYRRLNDQFAILKRTGRLVVLSNVSEENMSALRLACRAFVLPSRYEGYGFPMVEAVHLKKIAIYSNNAAFMEIVQRHGYTRGVPFENGSVEALTKALNDDSGQMGDTISRLPSSGAQTWTWSDTAGIITTKLN